MLDFVFVFVLNFHLWIAFSLLSLWDIPSANQIHKYVRRIQMNVGYTPLNNQQRALQPERSGSQTWSNWRANQRHTGGGCTTLVTYFRFWPVIGRGRFSILKYASPNLCTSGVCTCGVHLKERTPGGREDARTGGRSFSAIGTRAYLMTSSYLPVPAF